MAQVLTRERAGRGPVPAGPPPPRAPGPAATPARDQELLVASAVALAAVTATAAVGLGRLFGNASFLPPVLVATVAAHLIAAASRRYGLAVPVAAGLSLLGLALVVVWTVEPQSTAYGVPAPATFNAITHDLASAWQRFGEVIAPAPVSRGFVLASVIGVWVAASAADAAAFRLGAPFEATIPSFTVFIFGAVLGADRHRVAYTTVYLAAFLIFLLLLGAARHAERVSWFGGRRSGGATAIVRRGMVLVAVAVAAAVLIGPSLPGARSDALIRWRPQHDNGPTSRVTVSPLVDIRNRLVDQSNVDMFGVESNAPAYWRLTSLDRFDGQIWSSVGTYRPARTRLPEGVPAAPGDREALQRFTVSALSSIWLPAAYRPTRLAEVTAVRFDADSSSLLAEAASSDGLRYRVASALPVITADQLSPVHAQAPREISRRYLELPADFPERVRALAAQVTGGARSPYQQARALQDFLRGNFSYDLKVPPGHDNAALERFLFVTRRGYCEQFAGTYAAMARAVGLPARVAVGFTPGDVQGPGSYRVRGRHAHAWPEVYLDGFGWVAFEPTPGRGMPGAEGYTGVQPPPLGADQAAAAGAASPATTLPPPTTVPAPSGPPPPRPASPRHASWLARNLSTVALVVLALALLACATPAARWWRRRRRRAAAATPAARVLLAWEETGEQLAAAGHPRHRWETTTEYVQRAQAAAPSATEPLYQLAGDATTATFSATPPSSEVATRAERAAAAVTAEVLGRAGRWRRIGWAVDPRPLLARHRTG